MAWSSTCTQVEDRQCGQDISDTQSGQGTKATKCSPCPQLVFNSWTDPNYCCPPSHAGRVVGPYRVCSPSRVDRQPILGYSPVVVHPGPPSQTDGDVCIPSSSKPFVPERSHLQEEPNLQRFQEYLVSSLVGRHPTPPWLCIPVSSMIITEECEMSEFKGFRESLSRVGTEGEGPTSAVPAAHA